MMEGNVGCREAICVEQLEDTISVFVCEKFVFYGRFLVHVYSCLFGDVLIVGLSAGDRK